MENAGVTHIRVHALTSDQEAEILDFVGGGASKKRVAREGSKALVLARVGEVVSQVIVGHSWTRTPSRQ